MDIFEFAMKMEMDGQAHYEKMAAGTNHEGLKSIFLRLADDEKKHYRIFQKLKEGQNSPQMATSNTLDESKNIFAQLQEKLPAVSAADSSSLEAYQFAMRVEADSAKLYRQAADSEANAANRKLLLQIADEEEQHFQILDNVYQFVNAPNEYLAWGEFSNLDEFVQFGREGGLDSPDV